MSECKDCKVFDQGAPCYGGSGEGRCKQLVPKWVDDLIPTEYEPDIVGIHRPADDCPCFSTKDEPSPESVLRGLTRYDLWYWESDSEYKMTEVERGRYVLFSDVEKTVAVLRALREEIRLIVKNGGYCENDVDRIPVLREDIVDWLREIDRVLEEK